MKWLLMGLEAFSSSAERSQVQNRHTQIVCNRDQDPPLAKRIRMQLLYTSSWPDSLLGFMLHDWIPFCGNNKRKAPIWHLNATAQGPVPGKCWPLDFCCSQFFFSTPCTQCPLCRPRPCLRDLSQTFSSGAQAEKVPDLLRTISEKSMNHLQSSGAQWFCLIHRKRQETFRTVLEVNRALLIWNGNIWKCQNTT